MKIVRYSWNIKNIKSIYQEISKIKIEYEKRKYQENPEVHKEYRKKKYKKYQENKKKCDKVMHLHNCNRSLYLRSVGLFKQEKYHNLTEELCHPVKSFDTKLYICETCHKHLIKNEIPCHKMAIFPIPDILKDLKKLEKVLISKRILFKKIAIMHGKGEFSKIKGSICNIPIEVANVCNILPRPSVSNGLIVVKLKRDLKYRGHVYFEPVRPHVIYQALIHLKSHNKFYEDISIAKGLSSEDMLKFSDFVEMQGETEKGTAESICNAKENVNESKTEYASVEDPLNIHRTASNETTLVSDIPNIVSNQNIIAPGQGKISVSVLSDEFWEEQAFPYRLPTDKFGYNAPKDIPISPAWYFNQRLLNFNQWFASDADYIFFARSVYELYHLRSSKNFAMHKIANTGNSFYMMYLLWLSS